MKYYRLLDNLDLPDRWFLNSIEGDKDDDVWKYTISKKILSPSKKLYIEVMENGKVLDFTFSDYDIPIVSSKVASILKNENVQLIPIGIKGMGEGEQFYIMVVLDEIECVDEKKSDFEIWKEDDEIRPDKAGLYKSFFKLVINPSTIKNNNIFRIKKYDIVVVVSEYLKTKFEELNVSGVKFEEVT